MENKTFAVVGKVVNGRITVFVATKDRVVGYSKAVTKASTSASEDMVTKEVPADISKPAMEDKPQEVDSPFFDMVHRNSEKVKAEREARMSELYTPQASTPKKRKSPFRVIKGGRK